MRCRRTYRRHRAALPCGGMLYTQLARLPAFCREQTRFCARAELASHAYILAFASFSLPITNPLLQGVRELVSLRCTCGDAVEQNVVGRASAGRSLCGSRGVSCSAAAATAELRGDCVLTLASASRVSGVLYTIPPINASGIRARPHQR
jgi:hypothetical protein